MKTLSGVEKVLILEKLESIKKELNELTDFADIVYKSDLRNLIIISEFTYKGFYCTFFKDNKRFIFTYEKGTYVEVCIFNTFEEILCFIIDGKLLNRKKNNTKKISNMKGK